ncbi:MAG: hypothetical protein KAH18_05010 [Psychromonas sp.]|nr:hypothetical protein [Psychromonas sp.]
MLTDNLLLGNQAYKRSDEEKVHSEHGLKVLTPIKKQNSRRSYRQRTKNIQMQDHA